MSELISISQGNTKLGKLPNISLIPVADCGNCSSCKSDCYALKAWRQYPGTRAAWRKNSRAARLDQRQYFDAIITELQRRPVEQFRWHIAGDILNQEYLLGMYRVARAVPDTQFLVFTKMHGLNFKGRPSNLTVVLSMWPGMPKPGKRMPHAWLQDGSELRAPSSAVQCPGRCDGCWACWELGRTGGHVVFKKH